VHDVSEAFGNSKMGIILQYIWVSKMTLAIGFHALYRPEAFLQVAGSRRMGSRHLLLARSVDGGMDGLE
jgi:hypothetical protein